MSKKKNSGGFIFSTNPDFAPEPNAESESSVANAKQVLRVWLERGKGNKESTVVKGYAGSDDDLTELARLIKNKCAAGGNAKDGIIIVQGNHRDKVVDLLIGLGYTNTKKAGG